MEEVLTALNAIGDSMQDMADESGELLEKVAEICRRSEETEKLVNECLRLLGEE